MQRTGTFRRRIVFEILSVVILLLLIFADQFTKIYIKNLAETTTWNKTTVIEGFIYIDYLMNTGAAFGFLGDKAWGQIFFKIITVVALACFIAFYVIICKKNYKFLRFSLILIIAGTIGNFIDRLAYGAVVDFLSFILFGGYHFPTFNLADTFLTVGVIMLIIHYLFLDENSIIPKRNGKKDISSNEWKL